MVSLRSCLKEMADWGFSPEYVVKEYLTWVSVAFYVFLQRYNNIKQEDEYAVFRSRKRGDAKYVRHVKRRFYALGNAVSSQEFFSLKDRGIVSSPVLFATLEYDANRYDQYDCWKKVGTDFNRWLSYLRRKYGKSATVRVWESHESGYPHIHIAVAFEDHIFFGGYIKNRRGKGKFRVKGRDYSILKKSWKHGFSDFVLCNSVKGAFKYAGKYLMKGISAKEAGSKAVKGLAMCWVFRKRSFSISGSFRQLYHDEIRLYINSNNKIFCYELLDGSGALLAVTKWKVIGFMESEVVRWTGFQQLSNNEIANIMDEEEFFLKEPQRT